MKKIFSFVAAALIATSAMFAGENLFNPATTSLSTWFADAGWTEETQSTAEYDATTGVTTVNIAVAKAAQWQAQVKLNTDLTALDPAKQYDFSFKMTSNVDVNNVTAKFFDNAEIYMRGDINLLANGISEFSATNKDGAASNGVIVFDFGFAPAGAQITISDISISESDTYIHNCASIMNLQNNDEFTFGAFQVVYVNGKYTYIKDTKGSALIYKDNYGLVAGDYVDGLEGKLSIYKNLYEIVPTTEAADLVVLHGNAPALPVATAVPGQANMNAVVVYKQVHVAANVTVDGTNKNAKLIWGANNDTIALFNQFGVTYTFEAGKEYNVTMANSVYNANYQAYLISAEVYEAPTVEPDNVDHGLYNPANAEIDHTYFATGDSWTQGEESTAELVDGQILIHIDAQKAGRWQGQVFFNSGVAWEAGKSYKMEFDLYTNNQLGGVDIKFNNSDENIWYQSYPNDDTFFAEQDVHYVAEPINVASLEGGDGLIVFGIGWCPAGTNIRIHNIQIVETGDYTPVEEKMYIKHPWGTGADADWTWQEMEADSYGVFDAWSYEGKWGGVGCNIADNAEGADAAWYATADIQFLSPEELVLPEPAVGTDAIFYYIPSLVGSITSPMKVVYISADAVENINVTAPVQKMIIDGQVYILRDGVRYNALGAEVK